MGVLNFLLKAKIKKTIKDYLIKSKMDNSKINVLFNESYIIKFHIDDLAKNSGSGLLSLQRSLEISMVTVAEYYMDQLLEIEFGEIFSEKDFAKLHFCIAVMTAVTYDQWPSMEGKLIRLDLWHKHWKQINSIGTYITGQSANEAPFLVVLYSMMSMNYESGILFLPEGFPGDVIDKMIKSEYAPDL